MPWFIQFCVVRDVPQRDPIMLPIPDQDWGGRQHQQQQCQPGSRTPQVRARRWPEEKKQRQARDEKQRAVLAEKAKATPQTDPEPVSSPTIPLEGAPTSKHRGGPEQN